MPFTLDPALRDFATDRQWEMLEAWSKAKNRIEAGETLNINPGTIATAWQRVKEKAARQGWSPEHDYTRTVPDGFKLRGVSSYYGKDGELKGQWVKSQADNERQREMFEALIKGASDDIPKAKPVDVPAGQPNQDLLTVYPVGDHHLGMLSWARETGGDWDLSIGEKVLENATDYLVNAAPHSMTAILAILGDFLHYDSFATVTPTSHNQLDSDTRFPKLIEAATRALRYQVQSLLTKHNFVHIIVEIGNHDLASSIWLMHLLQVMYEREPRVTVDTSPAHFHYYRFGRCLIGTHHGHGVKMQNLPLLMAQDRPRDWGQTEHRMWFTGHIHHSKTQAAVSAQDFTGCTVESFRVLGPEDAWAAQKGYRSIRDMKSIVLHESYGEMSRNTVNMQMFGDKK